MDAPRACCLTRVERGSIDTHAHTYTHHTHTTRTPHAHHDKHKACTLMWHNKLLGGDGRSGGWGRAKGGKGKGWRATFATLMTQCTVHNFISQYSRFAEGSDLE